MATKKPSKANPSWSDVKARLADFDRAGLLGLVQDLYAASKDNKAFLHARFGLGDDPLEPYKDVITQWINPPDFRNPISVSKAKKCVFHGQLDSDSMNTWTRIPRRTGHRFHGELDSLG